MNVPDITVKLLEYASSRGGQFTRQEFVRWGAHHGVCRRTPDQVIDAAFANAITAGSLKQVTELPGAALPTYRRA